MMLNETNFITLKQREANMTPDRGRYIFNTAYISPNWQNIYITDKNELSEIARTNIEKKG